MVRTNTHYGRLLKTDATGRAYVEVDPNLIGNLLRRACTATCASSRTSWPTRSGAGEGKLSWPLTGPAPARAARRASGEAARAHGVADGGSERRAERATVRPPPAAPPPVDSDQRPDPGPELLLQTLRANGWSKVATAAQLGISRDSCYRLMEKFEISARPERHPVAARVRAICAVLERASVRFPSFRAHARRAIAHLRREAAWHRPCDGRPALGNHVGPQQGNQS